MSAIAIRVENLSKLYHIGRAQQRHDTLRDAISDFRLRISDLTKRNPTSLRCGDNCPQSAIRNPTSLRCGDNCPQSDDLSRITEPTSGRAEINDRVGSLLEVGTGSPGDPELTGRENIRYA